MIMVETGYPSAVDPIPLVIVQGFLGAGGSFLWGAFEDHLNHNAAPDADGNICRRRIIFANVGPVSSLHDRACELYYELVGGTVDYGEEHAKLYGHQRFGRTYPTALYPGWSANKPLHFLGHSMGGPTIVKLQHLLKTGLFGSAATPDMILSLTSVSAPFRGTQLVYALGERADAAPAVRTFSIGGALTRVVHVLSYLSPILPPALDLHSESRRLSFRDASITAFWKQLWKSDWAESRDATPFDATFQAADEREANGEGGPNPSTHYRSYVARLMDAPQQRCPIPSFTDYVMTLSSTAMKSFKFQSIYPIPTFLRGNGESPPGIPNSPLLPIHGPFLGIPSKTLIENDGVVPVFSQHHPFECGAAPCTHSSFSERQKSGIWFVKYLENANHLSIAPIWRGSAMQIAFWKDVGNWLQDIDHIRGED